jgi:hypothetical protein
MGNPWQPFPMGNWKTHPLENKRIKMSTGKTAKQRPIKTVSEVRLGSVNFTDDLDSGELLTGTPTVTELSSLSLTLANKSLSSATMTILGETAASSAVVQFTWAAGTTGNGMISIKVATDSTPAQTLMGFLPLRVIADTAS